MHSVFRLTTCPQPLSKPVLRRVRSVASAFNFQYPFFSLRSSNSCLRLLLRLPVSFTLPSVFPSITCFRWQYICKMWPINLAFLCFIICRIFVPSLSLCNTSSFLTSSVHLSPAPLCRVFQTFPICFPKCPTKSLFIKAKSKFHPRTGHEGPEGE